MKIAVDLHIHSCLSPCGDDDMTPNNIIGMAAIKGLDAVAVADHNSALNLPACKAVADEAGVLLVPAIEVQTREEVHILCYMRTVEDALELSAFLHMGLFIPNNKDVFGPQLILDADDKPIGEEKMLLAQSADVSMDELMERVAAAGGVSVPAHINRQSNSLLYMLGFLPQGNYQTVEISKLAPMPETDLSVYHISYASDAHYLGNIFERDNFITVEEKSVDAVLKRMGTPKQ